MKLLRSALALAGLSAAYGIAPTPIQLDVLGGETRCLADTVRVKEDTTFTYRAVEMEGTSIDNIEVIVEHPNGNPPHIETLTTEKKQHLVKADLGEGGFTYRVCFQSKQAKGQRTRVELTETTVWLRSEARPKVPKHLQPVDYLLQHATQVAVSLEAQLEEGLKSESERTDSDKVLRSRINKVAGFTILVLLSVTGWQLMLLNRFFRSKKLI